MEIASASAKKQPQNIRMLIGNFIYLFYFAHQSRVVADSTQISPALRKGSSVCPQSNTNWPSPKIMQFSSDNVKL